MMPINTVLQITVLALGARVQPSEESDGLELFAVGPVLVLEATLVALDAWSTQVVIVAELGAILALLNRFEDCLVAGNERIHAAGTGVPGGRGRLDANHLGWCPSEVIVDVFVRQRQAHLRRRARFAGNNGPRARRARLQG